MTDAVAPLRGGDKPHLVYTLCHGTWRPDRMGGFVPQNWRFTVIDLYELEEFGLDDVDVLLIPDGHDQLFMKSIEGRLAAYLTAGGHFFINGHLTLPWLPWLSRYKAVNPRPFTNWMIRPANPGRYFGRMDFETYHRWEGILGQYGRGYSDPPPGAQNLCLIGGPEDEGPIDWVWRLPGGGKLFMHNGDNLENFCSVPRQQPNLFQDILNAIVFSGEPSPPRRFG
jgi:hypothetical protein